MGRSALVSFILHIVVLTFASMSFHNPFKKVDRVEAPLLIEFAQIAEKTAAPKLAPTPEKKQETKPEKAEPAKEELPPPPQTESLLQKTEPPKPQEKPEPQKEEKKLEPKKDELAPKLEKDKKIEKKKETPQKEAKKAPVKPEPAKKEDQKKDKKKTPEKAQVNLKKNQPNAKKTDKAAPKKKSAALDDFLKDMSEEGADSDDSARTDQISDVVTASQIDAIRSKIRKCWYIPAGLKNAKDITVDIKMELAEDGTVQKAEVVDKGRLASDADFRTAAESARRAVLDPECNPLPMPKGQHNLWKDLELSFNPRDMF
jgi:outer membrane biosynthesis protein TonB